MASEPALSASLHPKTSLLLYKRQLEPPQHTYALKCTARSFQLATNGSQKPAGCMFHGCGRSAKLQAAEKGPMDAQLPKLSQLQTITCGISSGSLFSLRLVQRGCLPHCCMDSRVFGETLEVFARPTVINMHTSCTDDAYYLVNHLRLNCALEK